MKKIFLSLALILAGLMLVGPAAATTVSFGDNRIFWPGYPSPSPDVYGDNGLDTIGSPQLSGGQAVIEDSTGRLMSIGISGTGFSDFSGIIKPGDLFIDVGANQTWDYVVSLGLDPSVGPGIFQVWKAKNPIPLSDRDAYLITGLDNATPWVGYDIRNDHPYALNLTIGNIDRYGLVVDESAGFSGFPESGSGVATFTFTNPIDVGGLFIIGWTENCANDVLYETVPEPGTLLLLGSGLVGLAGFLRRHSQI